MDTQEFMQTVLGGEGYYCIVGLKKDSDRPVQKFFPKLEDAINVAKELCDNGYDSYYALATFLDGKSRKTANVHQLKSLYIDLDCGIGKPYQTQQEAIQELKRFCKESGMPRPYIVNSGGGVHAYWPFEEAVSKEEWLPIAEQLKAKCDMLGLYADPVVTADCARILRVPGTSNYKDDAPRPVSVIYAASTFGDISAFRQILGEPLKAAKAFVPRGEMDEVTKALLGNQESRFTKIMQLTNAGEGCEQLKYIVETRSTLEEPLWRAGLSIAKHCVDADTAILTVSEGHPEYTPDGAYHKAALIKAGPYTCKKIDTLRTGVCQACPHWGTFGSPIRLGKEIQEASDEDNIVESQPDNAEQGHTQSYVIPKFPPPYFRGKTGGVYKRVVKDGDEVEQLIYHNDIYVVRRLSDPELGESIVIRLHLPKDAVREFTLPLAAVSAKDELRKHLASKGVAVYKIDDLSFYILAWVNHMQYSGKADIAHRQFGWTGEDCEAFILGDKEVRHDRVDYNPPTAATAHLFKAFTHKGSLEEWKTAINFYNRPNMELHQFSIGLAFGSIFTAFTAVNSALCHIFSPDSGIGKTTSLYAGASIWGNPTEIMLKESDTANSKMNRAEAYNNIFLPIDELTNSSAKELSDFVMPYTSGKQRNRMTMSANQERVRGAPWKQVAVSTGNTSAIEKMSTFKALPKGEAMRILEIRAVQVDGLDKIETDALSLALLNNYGHAGIVYLQSFMEHMDEVKALYAETQQKLDKKFGFTYSHRFYSVIVANSIVGLMLAKKAGLIDFDLKKVVAWLGTVLSGVHIRNEQMDMDPEALLNTYLSENFNNTLRIKSTEDARSTKSEVEHLIVPDATPKNLFLIRYEYDIKKLYLLIPPFKKWCVHHQIPYEGLLEGLRKGKTNAKLEKKRMGKGTRIVSPATLVLVLDCNSFDLDNVTEATE